MSASGSQALPLDGVRVLEYSQYVAGPFAGMLLADLGADVIKVEAPGGDAWRGYASHTTGHSRSFYGLNRNKRSVVIDLKQEPGRHASAELIRTADVVLHNMPPERALRYGLDRERVRELNPEAVWCCVSALGSDGPDAAVTAFDMVAQALSGLLLAAVDDPQAPPKRAGGIAIADFTAGLLATTAVLAGLLGRRQGAAPGLEVSLLGAALAVQAQQFVSVAGLDQPLDPEHASPATVEDLAEVSNKRRASEELEPYYRSYRAADGYFVLACLQAGQRVAAAEMLGITDPWAQNPQAAPLDEPERQQRLAIVAEFERTLALQPAATWVRRFRAINVPAGEVRRLEHLFDDAQANANGLVATVSGGDPEGPVRLLGGLFKVDGVSPVPGPIPSLGEHTEELLGDCEVVG